MRRLKPTSIAAAISAVLLFGSGCSKDNPLSQQGNDEQELSSTATLLHSKKGGAVVGLNTRVGHTKEDCDGSCHPGYNTHRDCAGHGKACQTWGTIEFEKPLSKSISTPLHHFNAHCLYPEDFSDYESLAMPARSFYMEETKQWLNIPQQILERDPQTYCFLIKNITFTGKAAYSNL